MDSSDDDVTARFAAETERLYPLAAGANSGYQRAIRTGEPELVGDPAFDEVVLPAAAADATHLARLRKLRMYSGMVVPLLVRGKPVGAITFILFGEKRRSAFDTGDLALATELARRAALALDNAWLFAAERAARATAANAADRVQALADASRIFAEVANEPQRLMDELCRVATHRIGDMCVVRLLSPDGESLHAVAAYHLEPEAEEEFRAASFGEVLSVTGCLTARIVRDGNALLVSKADPAEIVAMSVGRQRRFVERHPFNSVLGVALRAEGHVLGTMLLAREAPDRPYTHDDVALVQDLADRASLALERARLFAAERSARAEAERAAELTRRMQEITASFASTMTLDEAADLTLSLGLNVLGAESGAVYRMLDDAAGLELISYRGVGAEMVQDFHRLPLDANVPVTDVARVGEIMFLDDRDTLLARQSRDEAQRANRAKSDLLAKVSHETRQPVHATVGWIDTLDLEIYGPLNEQQRDALRRIKSNQSRLLSVLNDLLDISRIQAGKLELNMRDVAVSDVVDAVESAVGPQMRDNGIDYDFRRPDPSVRVHADADQLVGILTNLLGNAAKFTPRDGTVTVRCETDSSTVRIVVKDTGIGIPDDLLDRVFEPFFQVESGFTRTKMGTGLGLAISREAARTMGGDVTVRSTVNEGSAFTVVLPRA